MNITITPIEGKTGEGKTRRLLLKTLNAARAGKRVEYISCEEMPWAIPARLNQLNVYESWRHGGEVVNDLSTLVEFISDTAPGTVVSFEKRITQPPTPRENVPAVLVLELFCQFLEEAALLDYLHALYPSAPEEHELQVYISVHKPGALGTRTGEDFVTYRELLARLSNMSEAQLNQPVLLWEEERKQSRFLESVSQRGFPTEDMEFDDPLKNQYFLELGARQ